MPWGNCFTWAVPKWLRGYLKGKVLVIRKSAISWVPHAMTTECIKALNVEEYIPNHFNPKSKFLRILPLQTMFFRGRIRKDSALCLCPECSKTNQEIVCKCPKCKKETIDVTSQKKL